MFLAQRIISPWLALGWPLIRAASWDSLGQMPSTSSQTALCVPMCCLSLTLGEKGISERNAKADGYMAMGQNLRLMGPQFEAYMGQGWDTMNLYICIYDIPSGYD